MSSRVLNFFEFSDKYSAGNSDPLGMDDMTNASSNFEEGFDDTTYDQPELGPKRPVSGNYEATPAGPGEGSVPAFSPGEKPTMNAPEEDEDIEDETDEVEEDDDDAGNPEGDETEEEEEKVEESFKLIKSFSRFVNESYDDYYEDDESSYDEYPEDYSGYDDEEEEYSEDYGANPDDYFGFGANPEDEYGMYPEDDDYEAEEFCSNCGAVGDEYGYSCGCNM